MEFGTGFFLGAIVAAVVVLVAVAYIAIKFFDNIFKP